MHPRAVSGSSNFFFTLPLATNQCNQSGRSCLEILTLSASNLTLDLSTTMAASPTISDLHCIDSDHVSDHQLPLPSLTSISNLERDTWLLPEPTGTASNHVLSRSQEHHDLVDEEGSDPFGGGFLALTRVGRGSKRPVDAGARGNVRTTKRRKP